MANIFDLSVIHPWAKEEIAAYGEKKAKEIFADRADRAEALIPMWVRYVDVYAEPLCRKAVEIWKDYSIGALPKVL